MPIFCRPRHALGAALLALAVVTGCRPARCASGPGLVPAKVRAPPARVDRQARAHPGSVCFPAAVQIAVARLLADPAPDGLRALFGADARAVLARGVLVLHDGRWAAGGEPRARFWLFALRVPEAPDAVFWAVVHRDDVSRAYAYGML